MSTPLTTERITELRKETEAARADYERAGSTDGAKFFAELICALDKLVETQAALNELLILREQEVMKLADGYDVHANPVIRRAWIAAWAAARAALDAVQTGGGQQCET